jgi:hypothetical protein
MLILVDELREILVQENQEPNRSIKLSENIVISCVGDLERVTAKWLSWQLSKWLED